MLKVSYRNNNPNKNRKLFYISLAILIVLAAAAYVFGHLSGRASTTLAEETVNSRTPIVKTARRKKCECCKKMSPELRAIVEKHLK